MLALSRNKGESIVCRTKSGEEITITNPNYKAGGDE